jgi:hypothetical protein
LLPEKGHFEDLEEGETFNVHNKSARFSAWMYTCVKQKNLFFVQLIYEGTYLKVPFEVFCVEMPFVIVVAYHCLRSCPEDVCSMILRNVGGILP